MEGSVVVVGGDRGLPSEFWRRSWFWVGERFNINIHHRRTLWHFSLRCLRTGERRNKVEFFVKWVRVGEGRVCGQRGKKNVKNCLWDR